MRAELLTPEHYEILDPAQQDALCQEILAEVSSGQFKPAGEPSREHWRQVWATSQPGAPPFIKPAQVLRVNQQFVRPSHQYLETMWYRRFRANVLRAYLRDVAAIYEFGCGNGWNLVAARGLYPTKRLMGLDWALSALDSLPAGITRQVFDFFQPDYDVKLVPGAGVWTVGALEQTGSKWGAFLEYLLANKPALCVHVEPIVEWYDPANPVDQTAIEYHKARKYWEGFPAHMAALAAHGVIEILEQKRSFFGSKYIEGYSLFCWKPI